MTKTWMAVVCGLWLIGCTDEAGSRSVLEQGGYTNITMTGYEAFDCSEDDTIHDGFEATGPTGRRIRGTVCCGLFFKSCTVRVSR